MHAAHAITTGNYVPPHMARHCHEPCRSRWARCPMRARRGSVVDPPLDWPPGPRPTGHLLWATIRNGASRTAMKGSASDWGLGEVGAAAVKARRSEAAAHPARPSAGPGPQSNCSVKLVKLRAARTRAARHKYPRPANTMLRQRDCASYPAGDAGGAPGSGESTDRA